MKSLIKTRNTIQSRIRLIYSNQMNQSIGLRGDVISFDDRLFIILWEDYTIEIRDFLESDLFFADYILDGYTFLTMDDVLNLSIQNFETIKKIKNETIRNQILNEYALFIYPLQENVVSYNEWFTKL